MSDIAAEHEAAFFDSARHAEALARLASDCLADGRAKRALPFIDRRCRVIIPSARDLFVRALAHRAVGLLSDARRDLARAIALNPSDAMMNLAALSWGDDASKVEAAERLSDDDAAPPASRAEAVRTLFAAGRRIAYDLKRRGTSLSGWVCWASSARLEIRARASDGDLVFAVDADPAHPLAGPGVNATYFTLHEQRLVATLELALDGETVSTMTPTVPANSGPRLRRPPAASQAPLIHVIVPVYEDFDATRACLDSLVRAGGASRRRVIVVDDASPSARLRAYLDAMAARGGFDLIRNDLNLGFAASVNVALARCGPGDVLLLNADALLPDGAIERLQQAAHASPDIGTVTPFSNNGELASYPLPLTANPLPSETEVAALDAKARRAHGASVIDMPCGVGFCLYIRRDCLNAVGPLPQVYAQGYYEDVEFCLRAAELGFRNVCAPGVFVGHAGSKSFGARKRALVVRNLALLERRFPDHSLEMAAFLEADPLRSARSALDEQCPPNQEIVLLACGAGVAKIAADRRAAQLAASGSARAVVVFSTDRSGRRVAFRRAGGGAPHSLGFDLNNAGESNRLIAYFAKLRLHSVELFDAGAIAEPAFRALLAGSHAVAISCGAFDWLGQAIPLSPPSCRAAPGEDVCAHCTAVSTARTVESDADRAARDRLRLALTRANAITPLDRMGEAFARRVFKGKAKALELPAPVRAGAATPRSGPRRLGVFSPTPSPATDRLLLSLARSFLRKPRSASIVVLGQAVDDLGLMATSVVFVTGRVGESEYVELIQRYAITELACLDRTGGFGDLDVAAAATGLPKAYFDWSFGSLATAPGDLSMDPRICEEKAVQRLASWLDRRSQPDGDGEPL